MADIELTVGLSGDAARSLAALTREIDKTKAALQTARKAAGDNSEEIARLDTRLKSLRVQYAAVQSASIKTSTGIESMRDKMTRLARAGELTNKLLGAFGFLGALKRVAHAAVEFADANITAAGSLGQMARLIKDVQAQLNDASTAWLEWGDAVFVARANEQEARRLAIESQRNELARLGKMREEEHRSELQRINDEHQAWLASFDQRQNALRLVQIGAMLYGQRDKIADEAGRITANVRAANRPRGYGGGSRPATTAVTPASRDIAADASIGATDDITAQLAAAEEQARALEAVRVEATLEERRRGLEVAVAEGLDPIEALDREEAALTSYYEARAGMVEGSLQVEQLRMEREAAFHQTRMRRIAEEQKRRQQLAATYRATAVTIAGALSAATIAALDNARNAGRAALEASAGFLKGVRNRMIVKALEETALGVASAASLNAPGAAAHFAAAGLASAAAVAAGAGAAALGAAAGSATPATRQSYSYGSQSGLGGTQPLPGYGDGGGVPTFPTSTGGGPQKPPPSKGNAGGGNTIVINAAPGSFLGSPEDAGLAIKRLITRSDRVLGVA